MNPYADSSFLVSCYVIDVNTAPAKAWLSAAATPLCFTALHDLEARNALKLGVFRKLIDAADAKAAWSNVEKDLRAGLLVKTSVNWPLAMRIAARLSDQHSAAFGTRTLDILHVAAAKTLRATEFVSFDNRQRTLAAAVGLHVAP